jgi:hypothetical protein
MFIINVFFHACDIVQRIVRNNYLFKIMFGCH